MKHEIIQNAESAEAAEESTQEHVEEYPQFVGEAHAAPEIANDRDSFLDEFVDEYYGDKISLIIEKACYSGDGNDKDDPNAYDTSLIFKHFLSDSEQSEIIHSLANNEAINDELQDKFKKGLADMISDADLIKDVIADPYLRAQHIEAIAHQKPDNPNDIRSVIWSTDVEFGKSEELRNLFSDGDFLERQYHISRLANHDKRRADYIKTVTSDSIAKLISDETVEPMELIKDPLLRKRHFDNLDRIMLKDDTLKAEEVNIWNLDPNFYGSIEYGSMLTEYAKKNPGIYENIDQSEVDALVAEKIEMISDEQLTSVMKIYKRNHHEGDAALARTLAPILGFETKIPKFTYGLRSDGEGNYAGYIRKTNSIIVFEKETEDKPHLWGAIKKTLLRRESQEPRGGTPFRIGVIGHELFHAHQWIGDNVPDDRKQKYYKNYARPFFNGESFSKGRGGAESWHTYRNQLIEAEAWAFGEKLEQRVVNLIEK